MSDNTIMQAIDRLQVGLGRLEAGQHDVATRLDRLEMGQASLQAEQASLRADVRARFDQLEGKVDKIAADLAHLGPRLSQMESDFGGQYVRSGTANGRLDALDVRVGLIERRLELRDKP